MPKVDNADDDDDDDDYHDDDDDDDDYDVFSSYQRIRGQNSEMCVFFAHRTKKTSAEALKVGLYGGPYLPVSNMKEGYFPLSLLLIIKLLARSVYQPVSLFLPSNTYFM